MSALQGPSPAYLDWIHKGRLRSGRSIVSSATDPFLVHRTEALRQIAEFRADDESRRSEFQRTIRNILEKREDGFYVLGDLTYCLEPRLTSEQDWRRRDINRLLSRHREDRPIKDARRWAQFALGIALIALASSSVSAVADFPTAWEAIACSVGADLTACDPVRHP